MSGLYFMWGPQIGQPSHELVIRSGEQHIQPALCIILFNFFAFISLRSSHRYLSFLCHLLIADYIKTSIVAFALIHNTFKIKLSTGTFLAGFEVN